MRLSTIMGCLELRVCSKELSVSSAALKESVLKADAQRADHFKPLAHLGEVMLDSSAGKRVAAELSMRDSRARTSDDHPEGVMDAPLSVSACGRQLGVAGAHACKRPRRSCSSQPRCILAPPAHYPTTRIAGCRRGSCARSSRPTQGYRSLG